MESIRRFAYKLKNLFQRGRAEEELEREVRSHLELLEDEFQRRGMSAGEARFAAKRALGGVEFTKELQRDARSWIFIERVLQDIQFAVRSLKKNATFSVVAIATLALGIGANSAIFTIVNCVLLRPLPYPDSAAMVAMGLVSKGGDGVNALTVPQFEFFRDHSPALQATAGFRGGGTVPLKKNGAPEWVRSLSATDGLFDVLGIHPAMGRAIARDDTRPGSPQVAILSNTLWRREFDGDPAVVGRQIELSDSGYTVVGVMPPNFTFLEQPADVIVALKLGNSIADTGMNTRVIARLKAGVSIAQAQTSTDAEFAAYRRAGLAQSGQRGLQLESYQKWLAGDLRTSVLMLFAAVGFLLLIACANVASLLMARASARRREISIRLALGCGRLRLLQQFLIESLVIASAGALAGGIAAVWALKLLLASLPWDSEMLAHAGIDARVLMFTGMVVTGATLVFGLASYWQVPEVNLNRSLKESAPQLRAASSRGRNLLVAGQVAVSVMLLAGAGLLIENLYRLHQQRLGFVPDHVYTMTTPFEPNRNMTPGQAWAFEQQVLRQMEATPGVSSAAVISDLPLSGPDNLPTQQEGHPEHSIGGMEYRAVSPEYFQTMKVRVIQGRAFREADTAGSIPVAIVSETVARAWWKGKRPMGDRVVVGELGGRQFRDVLEQPRQVVGVVADVKNLSVGEAASPTVYVPVSQLPRAPHSIAWVVRTDGDLPIGAMLRKAVLGVNADQRIQDVQSMADIVARSMARPSFNASLMSTFGALALVLTGVGVYGLLSFQVVRRTQEIGVRIALGAKRTEIVLMVIKEALVLAGWGVVFGGLGAFFVARILSSAVPGVRVNDPVVYAAVLGVLLSVALVASYVPARRASGIDPVVALRYD